MNNALSHHIAEAEKGFPSTQDKTKKQIGRLVERLISPAGREEHLRASDKFLQNRTNGGHSICRIVRYSFMLKDLTFIIWLP